MKKILYVLISMLFVVCLFGQVPFLYDAEITGTLNVSDKVTASTNLTVTQGLQAANSSTTAGATVGTVLGVSDGTPDAILEVSASGGASDLFMLSSDDGNDGDLFTVANSGSVAIGSASPKTTLHVRSGNSSLGTPSVNADDILVESSDSVGITLAQGGSGDWNIVFASPTDPADGNIQYNGASIDLIFKLPSVHQGTLVNRAWVSGDGANPFVTGSGEGNILVDGVDNHPSFAMVDGVPHKENIRLGTNDRIIGIGNLNRMDKPVIFKFDETAAKHYKPEKEFEDDIRFLDGRFKRVMTAKEQSDEYNRSVDNRYNAREYEDRLGFIVETLPDRFLSKEGETVVGIKSQKAILQMIVDLQKEVSDLRQRVEQLEAR